MAESIPREIQGDTLARLLMWLSHPGIPREERNDAYFHYPQNEDSVIDGDPPPSIVVLLAPTEIKNGSVEPFLDRRDGFTGYLGLSHKTQTLLLRWLRPISRRSRKNPYSTAFLREA